MDTDVLGPDADEISLSTSSELLRHLVSDSFLGSTSLVNSL